MRVLVLAFLVGFSFSVLSNDNYVEEQKSGFIQTFYVSPCSSWTYLRTSTSFGYGCSGYPRSVAIADGNDVTREISELQRRVRKLEEQLKVTLELLER